jgi:hypothetical protein
MCVRKKGGDGVRTEEREDRGKSKGEEERKP